MNKEYTTFRLCRFCRSKNIQKVVSLGKMPLAGGFLKQKSDFKREKTYPLELNFCQNCFLLQTSISINPSTLFKNYFYYSSTIKTLVDHFDKTARDSMKYLKPKDLVVEIGCNDGAFLMSLKKNKLKAIGVDPASNIVKPLIKKGYPIINSFFDEKTADKIIKTQGLADAVYSFHSLAHIENMHEVLRGIKKLLKPDGFLAFEVHYLGNLLKEMQYDMIYHEHLHYYSLLTLSNLFDSYEMEIFNVRRNSLRAGSIQFYIQNKKSGRRHISKNVSNLIKEEKKMGLNKSSIYLNFDKKIKKTKNDLDTILKEIRNKNLSVAGYGASGRGTVVLNYCKLDTFKIPFVVDDSPAKQGNFMPGTHNPILSPLSLVEKNVRYSLVFAWPFIKEVKKRNPEFIKNGGKFIVPLPNVKII